MNKIGVHNCIIHLVCYVHMYKATIFTCYNCIIIVEFGDYTCNSHVMIVNEYRGKKSMIYSLKKILP